MEIHRSSLVYSPRHKGPQPIGKIQRADEKNSQKAKPGVEVTITTKTNLSTDIPLSNVEHIKKVNTELVPPTLQFDAITNQSIDIRTQKALTAYSTEQNQNPEDNSAQIVSSVDYIV